MPGQDQVWGVRESQTKEMFYELGCWQPLELWQRWNGEKRLGQPGEKPDNTSVHQCPKHEILREYRDNQTGVDRDKPRNSLIGL